MCIVFFMQPRGGYGDQWVEPFYRGQYYNGYGYMPLPPPIDPRMYGAAPYGGYPMYGGHQQQQQQLHFNNSIHNNTNQILQWLLYINPLIHSSLNIKHTTQNIKQLENPNKRPKWPKLIT